MELTAANDRAEFLRIADRLCREFGGVVTERYPEEAGEECKEYWWIQVEGATLLLMRKPHVIGTGLSAEARDVELLVRIGQAFGVNRYVGWRWRMYWLRRWFSG